jgi:hypothetical protein
MEKWKAKYAFHFPTPSTATRYLQKSMRYTNNPTGTKDRADQYQRNIQRDPQLQFSGINSILCGFFLQTPWIK